MPSGEYRAWIYSEVQNKLEQLALGALPSLAWDTSDFDGDGLNDLLFTDPNLDAPSPAVYTLALSSDKSVQKIELGESYAYVFGEYVDVTGDGIDDIVATEPIPDVTSRWWVSESEDRAVHVTDVGILGSYGTGLADGDGDGLRELISRYPLKMGFTRWEVYEYATGDYFSVVLDDELYDRGPTSEVYPSSWFE